VNQSPPTISGTPQQGQKLSEVPGSWTNNPSSFSYQWFACDNSGSNCAPINTANGQSFTVGAAEVGSTIVVQETATNAGGSAAASSAPTAPVTPLPPVNTSPPTISGTPQDGQTLTEAPGSWKNSPTSFSYQWEDCNASGRSCTSIASANAQTYAPSATDIGHAIVVQETATNAGGSSTASSHPTAVVTAAPPNGPIPTTTGLVVSPTSAVTNQPVTLFATVTTANSAADPSGTLTFENGSNPISGCAGESIAPTGQTVTVTCQTSFAASSARLTAVFTSGPHSGVTSSASRLAVLGVGRDSPSIAVDVSPKAASGSGTTYTATISLPSSRIGPVQPTGTVEFRDGGQPIASCLSQPLVSEAATCAVVYGAPGAHSITAQYNGDANFNGVVSAAQQVRVVSPPKKALGLITSTMQWTFYYTPSYTRVLALVVNGAAGATVLVKCAGNGCPFTARTTRVTNRNRCSSRRSGACPRAGSLNLTPRFGTHRLRVGAQVVVMIRRSGWIGKYYSFVVRSGRGPRVRIACLAPGASRAGVGC
jgi:Bacterial Ig-like domain (group 3)